MLFFSNIKELWGWRDGSVGKKILPRKHENEFESPEPTLNQMYSKNVCNPSIPMVRWELETRKGPDSHRPANKAHGGEKQQNVQSHKVEGRDWHLRLSPDHHMCTVACMQPPSHRHSYTKIPQAVESCVGIGLTGCFLGMGPGVIHLLGERWALSTELTATGVNLNGCFHATRKKHLESGLSNLVMCSGLDLERQAQNLWLMGKVCSHMQS